MYTLCTIKWVDDGVIEDVYIKSTDDISANDEQIFFYGLSPAELKRACRCGTIMEGEWKVVEVKCVIRKIFE